MSDELDLSFVPDDFKGEDGKIDGAAFRTAFDDLNAFKAAETDRQAQIPKEASAYEFNLPEGYELPEGFDPAPHATKAEDGTEIPFDPASMINADDPDIPALQELLLKHQVPAEVSSALAGLLVNREIRSMQKALETANEQKSKLGPDADNRISAVQRSLESRLPAAQAKALVNDITDADTLRGLEAILRAAPGQNRNQQKSKDWASMSPRERIAQGLAQR